MCPFVYPLATSYPDPFTRRFDSSVACSCFAGSTSPVVQPFLTVDPTAATGLLAFPSDPARGLLDFPIAPTFAPVAAGFLLPADEGTLVALTALLEAEYVRCLVATF